MPSNVNELEKGVFRTISVFNDEASTAFLKGEPVRFHNSTPDGVNVYKASGGSPYFAGVMDAPCNAQDGSSVCVTEGVVRARVKAHASASPGAFLAPEDSGDNLAYSATPTNIMLITDLSGLSAGTVYGPEDSTQPLVLIRYNGYSSIPRTNLVTETNVKLQVPIESLYVWDAPGTKAVATTAANDDLAIVYNTFKTAVASIETGDVKASNSARKVGFSVIVPDNYVAGSAISLVANAGAKTTVSDTALTLDFEVVRRAAPTVDICATSAISINSLTAADRTFTITGTNVVPGDVLDCVMTIAYNDSATGTAVIGKVYDTPHFLLSVKG